MHSSIKVSHLHQRGVCVCVSTLHHVDWNFEAYFFFLGVVSSIRPVVKSLSAASSAFSCGTNVSLNERSDALHARHVGRGCVGLPGCKVRTTTYETNISLISLWNRENSGRNYQSGAGQEKGLKIGRLPRKSGVLAGMLLGIIEGS